jgi:predicted alpha/beta hydrolase family esterase
VVASSNDSFGSLAHAKHCAIAWGSTFVDIGQAGHINADSGYGEWEEGYALLQRFMV